MYVAVDDYCALTAPYSQVQDIARLPCSDGQLHIFTSIQFTQTFSPSVKVQSVCAPQQVFTFLL